MTLRPVLKTFRVVSHRSENRAEGSREAWEFKMENTTEIGMAVPTVPGAPSDHMRRAASTLRRRPALKGSTRATSAIPWRRRKLKWLRLWKQKSISTYWLRRCSPWP
jgi:hypothetical protein